MVKEKEESEPEKKVEADENLEKGDNSDDDISMEEEEETSVSPPKSTKTNEDRPSGVATLPTPVKVVKPQETAKPADEPSGILGSPGSIIVKGVGRQMSSPDEEIKVEVKQ